MQFITHCCAFYVWTRLSNGLHHASFPGSEKRPKRTLLSNMLLKFEGSRSISALSRGYFSGRREMSSGYLNWTVPSQRTMFHFSLFVKIEVSLRVGIGNAANFHLKRKPQAAKALKTTYLLHLAMWNAKTLWNKTQAIMTWIPTLPPAGPRVRIPTSQSTSVGVSVIGLLSKHERWVRLQLNIADKVEVKWRKGHDSRGNTAGERQADEAALWMLPGLSWKVSGEVIVSLTSN